MSVLEPSAGTGNLAMLARRVGGAVETNEIDPRRAELLAMLGFPVATHDAERLDNLLDPAKSFDAIVPPPVFGDGRTAERPQHEVRRQARRAGVASLEARRAACRRCRPGHGP
jgi:hypothetical protein